jgi:CheY-like chemotaxis protein
MVHMERKNPRQVLVIEGQSDGREGLGLLLGAVGFVPFLAKDTGEALHYLRKGLRPCLIVLDPLTEGDGWQFRVEQVNNPECAAIPVIGGVSKRPSERPEFISPEVEIPEELCIATPLDPTTLLPILERCCGA